MGPRLLEITQTCPRCKGNGTDPNSFYASCIRCEGNKLITTTQIEFPPSFIVELPIDPLPTPSVQLIDSNDPQAQLDDFVSVMNPEHN